jgi:hypothetical protein
VSTIVSISVNVPWCTMGHQAMCHVAQCPVMRVFQNHQFGSWVIYTESKTLEDIWLQQQLQMVTVRQGSRFWYTGPQSCSQCMHSSHFWWYSFFGSGNLQGRARQSVMNSLNSLDCPCEVILPSYAWGCQSVWCWQGIHWALWACLVWVGKEHCNAVYTLFSFSRLSFWVS